VRLERRPEDDIEDLRVYAWGMATRPDYCWPPNPERSCEETQAAMTRLTAS
jgi:hypothetical protein